MGAGTSYSQRTPIVGECCHRIVGGTWELGPQRWCLLDYGVGVIELERRQSHVITEQVTNG